MPEGRCLCGHVRYAYDGAENWRAHCHCESCRRATSSPFTTFFGVDDARWRWAGGRPAWFRSSPGALRLFCPACGSPVAYRADRFPGEIHFHAATLCDPSGFAPQVHVHWAERVAWATVADALPKR